MGVPKFFRWCAERYPSVITPFKDSPPPVDNLYLDMNGIIHNCTHPNDIDATRKAPTEKEMISAMFTYLEKLFNAIQPSKHFLMAVDGVAPRAKMNQQRQRRYRAGYEMMVAREEALERGEEVPEETDVFDSNCITPGTPFMVRVSQEFQYFVTMKLSTDPAWQNCKVIFSGHDCPGEGEHKIVDFIRRRKMQPDYNPDETHCMYGLDADLVMLALATHEPHFVLLREVVSFGPASRKEREREEEDKAKGIVIDKSYHQADEFVLFHINVLRDYLQLDIGNRLEARGSSTTFDLERAIDDFVFMCFFIGNDFLPSVPTVGINDGSMITMLQLYVDHILSQGLHLTHKGEIDWRSTELWLSKLGELEFTTIKTRQQEELEYQRNRAKRDPSHEIPSTAMHVFENITDYKKRYYHEKLGFEEGFDPTGSDMRNLSKHYLEGLVWVINYYYQGVPSWQWFYPHYYAPMASDLVNLPAIAAEIHFNLGKPFLPHQQLLSVLPPMSYRSMPKAYWPLLKAASSPLARFFPEHIQIDREGARAPWEGIVLIPFIEEKLLLAAYESVQSKLDPEEAKYNLLGPSICFSYDPKMQPYVLKDEMYGDLHNVRVKRNPFEFPPIDRFDPELCKGVHVGNSQLEGFSSLQSKRMHITPSFEVGAVNIFGMPTRKESLILKLKNFSRAKDAGEAALLLGKELLVAFPHYKRARVAALSDARYTLRASYNPDGSYCGSEKKEKTRDEREAFIRDVQKHQTDMKARLGIDVPELNILVYVHRFTGMKMNPNKGSLTRQFTATETCYPMPLVCMLEDIDLVEDSRYRTRDRSAGDMAPGSKCIYIGPEPKNKKLTASPYGSCGVVLRSEDGNNHFSVCFRMYKSSPVIPASLTDYAKRSNWVSLHEASEHIGISSRCLSTICSSLVTSAQYGSRELGLCLKFTGRNLARVGYAKFVQKSVNPWYVGNVDIFARMEKDEEAMGYHLDTTNKGGKSRNERGGERGEHVNNSSVNRSGSGVWFLSREALTLVSAYVEHFAPLIRYIETGNVNTAQLEPQYFMTGPWVDREADDILDEIEAFLDDTGIMDIPMITATEEAFPWEQLHQLEAALEKFAGEEPKEVTMNQVSKSHLYFPITRSVNGHLVPLPLPKEQTFHLGSRVVNCRAIGSVPFGARGTIVRLLASGREAEVMYDQSFIGGTRLDGRAKDTRAALTKLSALLVLPEESTPAQEMNTVTARGTVSAPTTAEEIESMLQKENLTDIPKPRVTTVSSNNNSSNNNNGTSDVRAASPPSSGVILLNATSPQGINVADLFSQIPSSKTPAPSPPHNVNVKGETTTTTTAAVAASSPPPTTTTTTTSTSKRPVKISRTIPETFVTGKIKLNSANTASKFHEWMHLFTESALKELEAEERRAAGQHASP